MDFNTQIICVAFYREMANSSGSLNMADIMKNCRLSRPNYAEWKRRVDLYMGFYDYSHCIKSECPPKPNEESVESDKLSYNKWIEADNKMKFFMLGYMIDSLMVSYMNSPSAKSIIDSLEVKFGKKSSAHVEGLWEKFIRTKLSEGEDARQHVINMIALTDELALQGRPIDDKTKISTILSSLPNSYDTLRQIYFVSSLDWTLDDLLSKVTAKEDAKVRVNNFSINIAEQKESIPKGSKSFEKKRKFKSGKNGWRSNKKALVKQDVEVKTKQIICYHCNKPGHKKSECHSLLRSREKQPQGIFGNLILNEINTTIIKFGSWWADSGATAHISNTMQGFRGLQKINDGASYIYMGNDAKAKIEGIGVFELKLNNGSTFDLVDCLYAPSLRRNLLSVSMLEKLGYDFYFGNGRFLMKKNNVVVLYGFRNNNMYQVHLCGSIVCDVNVSVKDNATYLWHLRLGHVSKQKIGRMIKMGLLSDVILEDYPTCESCIEGKMTKKSYSIGGHTSQVLERVHTDICGPMNINARGGYRYFITFTDDFSRYGYFYLMKHKSEVLESLSLIDLRLKNGQTM